MEGMKSTLMGWWDKAKKVVGADQDAAAEAHGEYTAPSSAPVPAGSAYTETQVAGRRRKSRKGGKKHGRRRHTVRK